MQIDSIRRYQELIENSSDIITLVNEEGVIQYQSPSIERILGYGPEELTGEQVFEFIHPDDQERLAGLFEEFVGTEGTVSENVEYRFRHSDGSWVWLESTSINHDDSSLDGIVVNSREISQQKKQGRELERQAKRLESFSVAFPDIAFIVDEEGVYRDVLVGQHSIDLLYEKPSNFIGRSSSKVLPDDLGQKITSTIRNAIKTGNVQELEYSLDLSVGKRWFEARIERLPFQVEEENAAVVVVRDITGRKEREAYVAEIAEELEILNRVIRHDIRNDMSVVLGWAYMLEDYVDDEGTEVLEKILTSAEHIVELTDIARDYVRSLTQSDDLETKPVQLQPMLQTEVDLRRESYPEAEFVLSDELPDFPVLANDMLSSVFRNLLNNAVQHNNRGNPVVSVSCDIGRDEVVVSIADNGPGIPDEQKDVIFGKGEKGLESTGTGIGLYLVRSLVEQWDGSVWVEDNEPTGAIFNVQLSRFN